MTIRTLAAAALLVATLCSVPLAPVSAEADTPRVAFRIRTLVGQSDARTTASDATVDGPPGTDITLDSRAGSFTMVAKLKTDLLPNGRVRIVADVTTRRGAGMSERGLPLFEEDVQRRAVELAVDGSESLVLLPFGRNPGGEELAVDVLPSLASRPVPRRAPLQIRIDTIGADGWLRVGAEKIPHRYDVEASIERDGREIARGSARCELGEPGTVPISSLAELKLTVNRYARECPNGSVDFAFDVVAPGTGTPIARNYSGVGSPGEPIGYDLGALAEKIAGGPATLRLRITPVDEEDER